MIKIGIVDDNKTDREALLRLVSEMDEPIETTEFSSGRDLLNRFEQGYNPDVLFIDYYLGDFNGDQFIAELESYQLKVQPEFMRALTEKHAANKRFVSMDLHSLNREEITSMIMKTLGLQRKEVKDDVLEGITIQSGGMPHFVNEILGFIKRQIAVNADFEMSDVSCRKHAFVESFVFSDTQCSVDFFR